MIKQIIKCLKENTKVTDWLINETETNSYQAFYVLQKLETTRVVKTTEYSVTVYHKYTTQGNDYVGSSTFVLSHKLTNQELSKKVDEAVFAATFIKNKAFEIVKGETKKTWKEKDYQYEPFTLLDKIATIFISQSKANVRFNALELFLTKTTSHIVNSQGVNLKKTLNKVNVEAIPSFDGTDEKVELYKYYTYTTIDFDAILNDAKEAINDVTTRYNAKKIPDLKKIDILLKGEEIANFVSELVADYSFISVYKQNTDKKIGDMIQDDPNKDLLTISYIPSSKADSFDKDGVVLKSVKVIEQGKLVSYFGDNQYANYLGIVPTGIMNTIMVEKGKTTFEKMTKKPYMEIIALSGIQIETYSDYIGGEVRLAVYFDGNSYHPVSGFSFSGSIKDCLNNLILSKETTKINKYQGPKYIKLENMDIL